MIDGDLWRVHADEQRWTSDRRERVGEAFVETAAPLGDDLEAGGNPWAGRAVEGEDAGRRRRRFDNGQRLSRAAAAIAAASWGVHGGQSRVLTRPGRGDLAITSSVTSIIAAAATCRVPSAPFPRSFR